MTGDGGSCSCVFDKDPFLPVEIIKSSRCQGSLIPDFTLHDCKTPRPSLQPGLPGAEASARLAQTVGATVDFRTADDFRVPRFFGALGTLPTVDRDLKFFKVSFDEEVNAHISNASALKMLSTRSLCWISILQDDKVIYISTWMAKKLLKCHFVCQFSPDLQVGRPQGSHVSLAPGLWPQFSRMSRYKAVQRISVR